MKAILCKAFGPAESLVIEELPDPQPGAGEVVIDVHAAGINFPDTLIIQGKYQLKPPFPFCPGNEAAGVVAAIGDGVDGFAVGDRVIAIGMHGAFAEKMRVTTSSLIPMPDNMDFPAAAGFSTTYGTSYYALKQRAQLVPGETLLVLGAAGGVGLTAVELGRLMGANVIAAASTQDKLDVACAAGAQSRINYSTEDLKARAKELTDGRGVDVVYDPVGGELAEQALRATGWGGRYLVIGFASGTIPKMPLNLTLVKGSSIVGVFWGAWAMRDPAASAQNFAELLRYYADGKIKPYVSEVFPMENYVEAFNCLVERRAKGKVILDFTI